MVQDHYRTSMPPGSAPEKHSTMPMDEVTAMDEEKFNVESIVERKEWQERLHQFGEGLSSHSKLSVILLNGLSRFIF
ncbi:hypothetical protein [Paenibacillus sp. Leaf72]|uniref:hypothetical protein n=1 Tax=Paenibacillus sp. Leaf72 TaxID=1736234 RepID=UPI000702127B|nr:hypothetical protein [Paenibacillus sp. Leaf72]KQN98949.1 hypothetical protein ASF12_19365 [Paenibacillus sp. Leaf72]